MNFDNKNSNNIHFEEAQRVFELLTQSLDDLETARAKNLSENYTAYLHGQIYGLATALKIIFPGPGNWGEKAAFLIRPKITEHNCDCNE